MDDEGQVGIGTATPDTELHIVGTPSTNQVEIKMEAGSQDWVLRVNSSTGQFLVVNDTSSKVPFKVDDGAVTNLLGIGLNSFNSPDADRVTINGQLDVTDAIFLDGTQEHPDYVFEPDYELESIADHAAFMWSEKHLPAVPAAPENGTGPINVAAHQLGMLEELEKAHIYIEQLHNAVRQLQDTVQQYEVRFKKLEEANE